MTAQHFRDVYEECYPRVLAYASSLVGRQVGEDITSETFTIAWRRVRDLPDPALPWLLGVARNLVRELRRRDSRQYALAAAEAQRIISGVRVDVGEDVAAVVTEREAALHALASLSDADRELLTLIAWHGLSARQAARVLGCTTATLTVRLHRARRRLEKVLDSAVSTVAVPAHHTDSKGVLT
ncbi:sigma-70 family RNA polymerase sigma factor [Streptomyces sp. NPDC006333]|uniref:RNA polymerase sigma factor n=1 Tax=unclassified Streptomyces TaxID=2593676 RepID=UPI0033A19971